MSDSDSPELSSDSYESISDCTSSDSEDQREPGAVQAVARGFRTFRLHAGQFKCRFTDLVFDMKGERKVMRKVVSWDSSVLDGLRHMEPAGPLYSIECHKGSIRRLHLPHCETHTDVKLTVAHVTGGNVEVLQPLKVTKTHVIIEVQNLSLFGLLKTLLLPAYPITAQVLLFFEKSLNKLHIHLLPGNVPVQEVQKRHENIRYITTSSKCVLTPGKKYRSCCKTTDREYVSQPEDEKFECDYGPNYHPTFEVFLNTGVTKVTLSLLDENGLVVWKPRDVKLTGMVALGAIFTISKDSFGADFVDKYKADLIQRVPSVMEIADCIKSKEFTSEMYNKIHAEATPQDKMRELYKYLNSAGRAAKAEFYHILREKHCDLVTELETGSGLD
ncbi:NACHT, LRR and PYD domains-containing protein 1b allele 2-like isoform X2 [Hemibagrus wyckioides]|uniref:NACHT, LRR and PYD domains-containing protein 1b allele 2-like isoform X2 n=1 Tax=Hemibagrus wyckioides TaxID=337641 RepID=UPI00266D2D8B|nr:NACHT, LRR and PYD domains-containing protein 1b allele 2-like isoform X2 [Hemibagrus wyckioides]